MTKRRWRFVAGGLGLLLTLILVGCHRKPAATPKKAAEPTITHVNFAVGPSIDALPIYVAEQQGYFTKQHLQVNITNVSTASDRVSGMNTGQFTGVISGLPEFIMTSGAHPTGRLVGTATNYVALLTDDPDVNNVKDLQGKVVGTLANSTQEYATDLLMTQAKVNSGDVSKKTANSEKDLMTAASTQTASAVSLMDPNASVLRRQGARTLGQTKASQVNTGIVFSNATLTHHPQTSIKFLKAYNQAVDYINAHPSSQTYQNVLVTNLGYPNDNLAALALPHFKHSMKVTDTQTAAVREWLLTNNHGLKLAPVSQYREQKAVTK
ncbi:ABC transporter substrate-binding protein [Furfurilactobacillus siliginis]|uniref:SsuA/THI5-like domain-containing protein n=1 Tax=Furfurilactobacillus siliginis TaxID=348151 RepID=A0A0R2L3K4_9LACO|nr:ABC transporter substrate-binding protein [Furfurilactobacillus siliginis]KRN96377.1 hypothetical protein IV55_GL001340 [Furfurilactobacillus siliginis]GEK29000.1 hypothetical protein LSI01_13110 [Furfurilactobacillus siliginis]